ncbi:hypothetical protein SARC_08368 [Sphaeroforma arctica JP610]|uniref:Phosphate transporter n=1 Tax=Sphaeroforma arctica JP610 TaxID=667725 RepID=A0A0L0FTD0_9EUKA|nr:hypothetical protein SARC_08368 [Sphaeroforma arctica JP610]KNC79233.1 hypothetical protein SARC_08368 [Sphaeroforma arctica JP610]|eukprot:XP_014153135.1 hypothetical protein SARC_08368 [Sphaeroforma arctica JP610]
MTDISGAPCYGMDPIFGVCDMQPLSWIVAVAIPTCFALAMVMGANDVANAFGTSVGAGVLTIRVALPIAAVFEFVGAITLGRGVSTTIRKGIVDVSTFNEVPGLLMLGNWCSAVGAAGWVGISTVLALPTSTTNAVVGAIVGFALTENGSSGVDWKGLGIIVASWIISPVFAGCMAAVVYTVARKVVLEQEIEVGLARSRWFLSAAIALIIFLVTVFIAYDVSDSVGIWSWLGAVMALVIAVVVFLALFYLPFGIDLFIKTVVSSIDAREEKAAEEAAENGEVGTTSSSVVQLTNQSTRNDIEKKGSTGSDIGNADDLMIEESEPDANQGMTLYDQTVERRFAAGQVVNACYLSFNHGANDIANVAGPVAGVWGVYITGTTAEEYNTPIWIICVMGVGISIGLAIWGAPVMRTMGQSMTKVTPARGFSMEVGTATAVLIASFLGIPVSTTHAAVGSVIAVGLCNGQPLKEAVNWKLFSGIAIGWVVTLPVAGGISAGVYALFRPLVNAVMQY